MKIVATSRLVLDDNNILLAVIGNLGRRDRRRGRLQNNPTSLCVFGMDPRPRIIIKQI